MQCAALMEILHRRRRLNKDSHVCFVDLEKAYDSVPQEALLAKLISYGFKGRVLQLIKGLYTRPTLKVRVHGIESKEVPFLRGVRQGDPCSPILFNLFINDIFKDMKKCKVDQCSEEITGLLFADDLVLLAETKEELEFNLEKLKEWSQRNEMKVNASKCGYMVVKKEGVEIEDKIDLHIEGLGIIKYNPAYLYLGLTITDDVSISEMVREKYERTQKTLHSLRTFLAKKNVHICNKVAVINSVLILTATYGAEIWVTNHIRANKFTALINKAI